jgi:hypothetical protein
MLLVPSVRAAVGVANHPTSCRVPALTRFQSVVTLTAGKLVVPTLMLGTETLGALTVTVRVASWVALSVTVAVFESTWASAVVAARARALSATKERMLRCMCSFS